MNQIELLWSLRDRTDLTLSQYAVAVSLVARLNGDDKCWPSFDMIATDAKVSRRTAFSAVQELARKKVITITSRTSEGGRITSNLYEFEPAGVVQPLHGSSATVAREQCNHFQRVVQPLHPKNNIEDKKEKGQEQTCNVIEFNGYQPEPIPNFEPSQEVVFKGGRIEVSETFRSFWRPLLGSNEAIDLAIIEATPYIQAASRKPLEAQLASQLARYARDKRDRDERYAAAAAKGGQRQRRHGDEPELNIAAIVGQLGGYANARPAD